MGTFNVDLRIGELDFSAWETVSALVDTGATCSMAPASLLRRLGVEPEESVEFELAGGEIVQYETGYAAFAVMDKVGRGTGHLWPGWRIPDGSNYIGRPGTYG